MLFIRILVDGYSLLHCWRELAPGKPRFSAAARQALVRRLAQYQDATGLPVTVVFDGATGGGSPAQIPSASDVEVLYSRAGQTADQLIERAAHGLQAFGQVLVVTDDLAERETVESAGAITSSCLNFLRAIQAATEQLERKLRRYNMSERNKFLHVS